MQNRVFVSDFKDFLEIPTLLNFCTKITFLEIMSCYVFSLSLFCILSCYQATWCFIQNHFSLNFVSWLLHPITLNNFFFSFPAESVSKNAHLNNLCYICCKTFVNTSLEIQRVRFCSISHQA